VVAKVRREERYHLMHLDAWMRRLAAHRGHPRDEVDAALQALSADALTVFTPLPNEKLLVADGVLAASMSELARAWHSDISGVLRSLDLPALVDGRPPAHGRDRTDASESFTELWTQFTSVARLEEGVEW
jgi:ring-1,2-phenylacetyl-CoA epoxidase subunit PaaC